MPGPLVISETPSDNGKADERLTDEERHTMLKRSLIPLILLAGLLGVLFGPSGALATGTGSQARAGQQTNETASLQRQVTDLGAQVKALTTQVKALQKESALQLHYIDSIYDSETCIVTLAADALQGTWLLIDKLAQPTLNTTFFGIPSPLDDRGVCGRFKIGRTLLQVPPTLSGFAQMIGWLQG
jgi:outer membrane murein-binding lipoprotein Lpp